MDGTALGRLLGAWFVIPASWPVAVGASVLVLVAGGLLYAVATRVLLRFTAATATQLDDLLVRRLRPAARTLVGLIAVHTLLALRGVDHGGVLGAVTVVELFLVAYVVIETAETLFFHYWLGERQQVLVPAVMRHLVLVVAYSAVVLSVLGSVTGLDLLPVLATSTVVTVVVGLALQDTLGNMFSGLALHAERPFGLGDWVLLDDVEGQVVHIGWRSTHLRTFSGDLVALPNSVIARARIHNFYAPEKPTARLLDVPVALSASPEQVERAVAEACARVPGVMPAPAPKAWLVEMTPLFTRYRVKFWLEDFQHHDDIESDLMKALWHALVDAGIQVVPASPALDAQGRVVTAVEARQSRA